MFSLFNILAILYIFRSVQLSITIWREWPEIKSEPLTPHKKSLANQASFFVAVPIAVLVHEAAHALAILLFGGEVVEFGYRVFWGYVVPGGTFSAIELWVIALAGTLGSLLVGVLLWLGTRNAQSSSVRYFGLRAVRFQIYFSLIYYPLFTLLGFDGDWRTIYDFSSTPMLSGVTVVAHAAILYLFWRFDRQGWFEAPAFGDAASQAYFEQLSANAAANPQDIALQLQEIDILRRGGAIQKAKYKMGRLIKQNPDSAAANLEMAALKSSGKNSVPKDAVDYAEKAIALGLSTPQQIIYAQELIGRYQLERGQLEQAEKSVSDALAALADDGHDRSDMARIELLILRNQIYRRQHNYNTAYQDLQQALTLAQKGGAKAAEDRVSAELEILAKHAGQPAMAATVEHMK